MTAQPTPSWNLSFASGKFLRFVSRRVFLIVATVSFFTLTGIASAQVYWNPAADGYTTQGGNGAWDTAANGWWNGTTNVGWTTLSAGQNVIFEGSGAVTGNSGGTRIPNSVTFQNLTGNYSFNSTSGNMRSNTFAATTTAGQSISLAVWRIAANSTVTHNGSGTLIFDQFGSFGTRTIGLGGSGTIVITSLATSNVVFQKTGGGILHLNGTTYDPGASTLSMELSNGTLLVDRSGSGATTFNGGLIWDSGAEIRLNLADLNTFDISGALTKGTGAGFAFDFNGFNATAPGTYNLLEFGSTDFSVGDFSATGITFDPGLSGSFGLTGTALTFSVIPEPSTWMLMTAALTVLLVVRRRSALR